MKRYIKSAEYTDMGTGLEYWYFTTHGVMPGSVPKGIDILEVKDTPNGSYFKTDKVILTDALKKYDIKERCPRDVRSSKVTASVDWDYYDKFDDIMDKYLPASGEGDTLATQIVTALTKLVYKWYNDGDVYDNTYYLQGWANDLSSYANWLYAHVKKKWLLKGIADAVSESDYEELLQEMADTWLDSNYLEEMANKPKDGSIYNASGPFKFVEYTDEDEELDAEYEDEYDDEDEEYEE